MRKHLKTALFAIAAVLALLSLLLYIYGDRVAVFLISRTGNIDVSYTASRHSSFQEFDFTNLTVSDNDTGMGITAKEAKITPRWSDLLAGRLSGSFKLAGVSFMDRASADKAGYESLSGLVAMPFSSRWQYREITGSITVWSNSIHIQDLNAASDEIKLSVSGDLWNDHTISSDIKIFFSKDLFSKIPDDIVMMVLADEPDGWRSLSVKLTGNYTKPSIQITGRAFRFNIGLEPSSPLK